MEKQFCVYLLVKRIGGTIYCGMTSNLRARVWQHKEHVVDGFTSKYDVKKLVWYEVHETAESAITREKQIKEWRRAWKARLIEETNPNWVDLYQTLKF